ncbi:MAG: rod shape-determining protein MreC [Candidatus Omnitrophota bacterium]
MSKKIQKPLIYVLIIFLPFCFLFISSAVFGPVKMTVVGKSSWPLRILLFPFEELRKILFYRQAYTQYQKLKEEAETLRSRLVGQEEILRENNRFRELFDFQQSLVFSSVAANVIGRDPTNWSASVIIDRGKSNGLEVGMPVVTALGVLGKIAEVGDKTSRVLLLSDPNFQVAAIMQRNRESGLVSGTLEGVSLMRYISPEADIRVGDKIITSKLSSSFPEGLLIGEVISVFESQSSSTSECYIEPAVSFSQTEEVIVLIK